MTDLKLFHQFSPGVIACYYSGELKQNSGYFEMRLKTGPKEKRNRFWMVNKLPESDGIVYSTEKINKTSSKKNEIYHEIDEIFNRELYSSAKSFYNSVTYGPRWLEKNGYELRCSYEHQENIQELLKEWSEWKLENPKLFRASFFWTQYKRSIKVAFENPEKYIIFTLLKNDVPVACHILYRDCEYAYSLAFFGKWEKSLSNYFEIACITKMKELGIKYLNRGYEMNKSLSAFKSAWPSKKLEYFVTKISSKHQQLDEFFN